MGYVENGNAKTAFDCSAEKANVFLIGDSIRMGYCETVKKELSDVAEVFYIKDNCRSSQFIIVSLEEWKNKFDDASKVNVVQFNCGHWDIARWSGYELPLTSEEEYAKNIKMIIDLLRMKFVNAKIIFATTTPMNPCVDVPCLNPRDNKTIEKYNGIAVKVAKENGVEINDLYEIRCPLHYSCSYHRISASVAYLEIIPLYYFHFLNLLNFVILWLYFNTIGKYCQLKPFVIFRTLSTKPLTYAKKRKNISQKTLLLFGEIYIA